MGIWALGFKDLSGEKDMWVDAVCVSDEMECNVACFGRYGMKRCVIRVAGSAMGRTAHSPRGSTLSTRRDSDEEVRVSDEMK